jgi:hypothetical protein
MTLDRTSFAAVDDVIVPRAYEAVLQLFVFDDS